MSLNQDNVVKATKKRILTDLCNRLDLKKQSNKCRIPRNFVSGLIHSHKTVCPWLTRDIINHEMRRRASAGTFYREDTLNPTTTSVEDVSDSTVQG